MDIAMDVQHNQMKQTGIYRVAQKSKLLTQYNSLLFLSHPV